MKELSDEEKARLQAKIEEARIEGTHRKQHKSEKPWKESFTKLLQEIADYSGGRITWPGESMADEIFSYPTLTSRLRGREFMLEIKRRVSGAVLQWSCPKALRYIRGPIRAVKDKDSIKPQDSIEYLHIRVYVSDLQRLPKKYSIRVKHKSRHRWLDRLLLFIQLTPEFHTGSREFDQRYSVELVSDRDKELLLHREVREPIANVEPFDSLEISSSWILWSQLLTDIEQLEFAAVRGRILGVLELVDAICSLIEDQ